MISLTAEQALRALSVLAQHREALTAEAIARLAGIPSGSLAKIMQALGRAGLTTAQRGPHGGFALNRAPQLISCLEVVRAIDAPRRPPVGDDALARLIGSARQGEEDLYGGTTLAALVPAAIPVGTGGRRTGT